jgi:hypothetical protein
LKNFQPALKLKTARGETGGAYWESAAEQISTMTK